MLVKLTTVWTLQKRYNDIADKLMLAKAKEEFSLVFGKFKKTNIAYKIDPDIKQRNVELKKYTLPR